MTVAAVPDRAKAVVMPAWLWWIGCTLLLIAAFVWWEQSPVMRWLRQQSPVSAWWRDVMFLLDWTFMCVAMMLPTAAALLRVVARLATSRSRSSALVAACIAAFLTVWALAGVIFRVMHVGIGLGFFAIVVPAHADRWTVSAFLALGGTYLLTPVASKCANACRSPVGFVARLWRSESRPLQQALRIGWSYGWSCLGCCWSQMVAMCMLGWVDPLWMLAGALMMTAQKSMPGGVPILRLSGLALLVMAAGTMAEWWDLLAIAPSWTPTFWRGCTA